MPQLPFRREVLVDDAAKCQCPCLGRLGVSCPGCDWSHPQLHHTGRGNTQYSEQGNLALSFSSDLRKLPGKNQHHFCYKCPKYSIQKVVDNTEFGGLSPRSAPRSEVQCPDLRCRWVARGGYAVNLPPR